MTNPYRPTLAEALRDFGSEVTLLTALSHGLVAARGRRLPSKRKGTQSPLEAIPAGWWGDSTIDCDTGRVKFDSRGETYVDVQLQPHPVAAPRDHWADGRYDFVLLSEALAMVGSLPAIERAIRDGTLTVSGIRLSGDSAPDPSQYTGIPLEQICTAEINWSEGHVTHTWPPDNRWQRYDREPVLTVYVEACVPRAGLVDTFPNAGKSTEEESTPLKASSAGRREKHNWELLISKAGAHCYHEGRPESLTKFAKIMQQLCIDLDWDEIPDTRTIERKLKSLWDETAK